MDCRFRIEVLKIKCEREIDKWKSILISYMHSKYSDDGEFILTQLVEQCYKQELRLWQLLIIIVLKD